MGKGSNTPSDDLAKWGPTIFVQEYRRRGWRDSEMAGVMARAGVSAGKIHDVLAHGREHIDLARMGPMAFVQEYRRRGWRNGDLAGVMARAGVSAGKIHQALSQPRTESTASRAWRAVEKASDTIDRVVEQARKLGTPASPVRTAPSHLTAAFEASHAQGLQESDLPKDEQARLAEERLAELQQQPPIPEGRPASILQQARAVAEQGAWGLAEGSMASAYDWMILMNSLRAPAVRQEIKYLEQFPAPSPERSRAEELKWDLPETWVALKQQLAGTLHEAAGSRLSGDLALRGARPYAEMAWDIGARLAPWLMGKGTSAVSTPDVMVSQSATRDLLRAAWLQPALKEAALRLPGGDRILATALSGLPVSVAKQIVAGERDPERIYRKARAELIRRAAWQLATSRRQGGADETVGEQ